MTYSRRVVDRLGLNVKLPAYLQPGSEPRRWMVLSGRSAFVVIGVGFLVTGTGLVGIGIALLLNGFGVVELVVDDNLGQALAVGLVISMMGGFFVGIATEGPIGHAVRVPSTKSWESVVAAVPALFVFIWATGGMERISDRLLVPYSDHFLFVASYFNAVQRGGITSGLLVGLPLMWAVREFLAPRMRLFRNVAPGVLFIAWMIGVIAAYQPLV